jgi:hypothetical protein
MLKALLQVAATLALLCIGAGVVVLSRDAHHLLLDADATMRHADAVTSDVQKAFEADEARIGPLLTSIDGAAAEQRAYWQKTSADSDKTVKALRIAVDRASLLLDHTDKQLNDSLLPDADRQLNLTAASAQFSFSSIGHAGDALTLQLNDLGPTLTNLQESSGQMAIAAKYFASASGHADNILGSGERTAKYYEKKLTTPATFAQKLAGAVLSYGSEARILFVGH